MSNAHDEDCHYSLIDCVDDSIAAAAGRPQTFQMSAKRFPYSVWILREGSTNELPSGVGDCDRKTLLKRAARGWREKHPVCDRVSGMRLHREA